MKMHTKKSARRKARRIHPAPFEGIASGPTLQYVVVPDDVEFVNQGRLWTDGRLVERAPRLVITRDCVRGEVNLLFCDERWRILHATADASVTEARRWAESFYPGLEPHWVDLGVTDEAAEAYMEKLRRSQGCSFCRRAPAEHYGTQFQVRRTRICGNCVKDLYLQLQNGGGS